jgi:hypothetical protein
VQCLYPPPGSASTEYGILRSFASAADRDAFYRSAFFKDWLARIEPMVEGGPPAGNCTDSKPGFATSRSPCRHVGKWPC